MADCVVVEDLDGFEFELAHEVQTVDGYDVCVRCKQEVEPVTAKVDDDSEEEA